MRTRNWSIRSKIIALVVVPLSALLALWIFATVLTAGPALNLLSARELLGSVSEPGQTLVDQLQRERRLSVVYLSDPKSSLTALTNQRAATDRAAAGFRHAAQSYDSLKSSSAGLRTALNQIFTDLTALPGNRKYVDTRRIDAIGAQNNFNGIIDTAFQMFGATAVFGDEDVDAQIRALAAVGRGQEYLSRIDSLLAGANAGGKFVTEPRRELLESIGTAQYLLSEGVSELPAEDRASYQRFNNSTAFSEVKQLESELVADSRAGSPSPVSAAQWQPSFDASAQQLRAFITQTSDAMADRATPVAVNVLIRLGAAGLLGLIALVVSLIVSIRVGRSLVGRLRRLRAEALEMADERLPGVVKRLQRGEVVDVDVETPPLEYGQDEIGQLGHAFNEVQRTAVQSAVEEAGVRRGINEVFLNIARRSQTLLHRQLALLDRMERRETEPDELEDLYRVDHLATRMRRHAEDLVILAGAAPGRGWRNPVPVIDVVRGAISEVEDYKRVDIRAVQTSAVLGRAVGDVIHLLAELLENAASFSPPQTRVLVEGQVLPNGYAIEIEDRGLGMSGEAIEDANRRLLEPPDFDPADSARLGLFVVAQLAARHGIRVSLRPSAYGGVTAIVLIPGELVTRGDGPGGPSPADQAWDHPLVGSGTDDPARHSLASLQWQGNEELRSITVTDRPQSRNGSTGPVSAPPNGVRPQAAPIAGPSLPTAPEAAIASPTQELPIAGGPAPSSVVEGLSSDGLVQRRRIKPRQERRPAAAEQFPTGLESPDALLRPTPSGMPILRPRPVEPPVPAPSEPAMPEPSAPDESPRPVSAAPEPSSPDVLPSRRAARAEPAVPEAEDTEEPFLPRRVRQASLAPQLRAPAVEPVAASARSPEQVRSLMSALQWGTTRGRLAAAGLDPQGAPPRPGEATTMAEAATVLIPVVREPVKPEPVRPEPQSNQDAEKAPPPGTATESQQTSTTPEKDA